MTHTVYSQSGAAIEVAESHVVHQNYDERLLCFLDILGFKETIRETIFEDGSEDTEKIAVIEALMRWTSDVVNRHREAHHTTPNPNVPQYFGGANNRTPIFEPDNIPDFQAVHFSDCIVISIKRTDYKAFLSLIELYFSLSSLLLELGHLFRGAVVIGKALHNKNTVFGPALNRAYRLESECAIYPRTILDNSVIRMLEETILPHGVSAKKEYNKNLISQDSDSWFFFDNFKSLASCPTPSDIVQFDLYCYEEVIRKHITSQNPGVKQKYEWLKPHYNRCLKRVRALSRNHSGSQCFMEDVRYIK